MVSDGAVMLDSGMKASRTIWNVLFTPQTSYGPRTSPFASKGDTGAVPLIFVTSTPTEDARNWSMNAWLSSPSENTHGRFHPELVDRPACHWLIKMRPSPGKPAKYTACGLVENKF